MLYGCCCVFIGVSGAAVCICRKVCCRALLGMFKSVAAVVCAAVLIVLFYCLPLRGRFALSPSLLSLILLLLNP